MYIAFLQSIRFPLGDPPSSSAQKENPADGSQHFSLGKARIGRAWKPDLGSRIPGLAVCAGIVSHLPGRAADAGHVHGPFCCWASACKPSSFCSSRRAQPEATHGRAEKSLQAELPSPPGNISGLLPGRRAPAITLPHSSECLQLVASVSCHQLSSLDSGNHHCLLLSSFSQTFFPKAHLLGCAHRGLLGHGFPVSSAAVSCEHSSQLSPLMRHS